MPKKTVVDEIQESRASTSAAITVGHDQECASVTANQFKSDTNSGECSAISSTQPITSGASSFMHKHQKTTSSFVVQTSVEMSNKIDMQLAKFFFAQEC